MNFGFLKKMTIFPFLAILTPDNTPIGRRTKHWGTSGDHLRVPTPPPDSTKSPKSRHHILFSLGGRFGTPQPTSVVFELFWLLNHPRPMPIDNFIFAQKMQKSKIQKHHQLANSIPQVVMFFKMQKCQNFSRIEIVNGHNVFSENLKSLHKLN